MIGPTRLVSCGQGQVLRRRIVVEYHEQVDVTVLTGVAARRRTEQDHPQRPKILDDRIE